MSNKDKFNLLLLVDQVEEEAFEQRKHYKETGSWHVSDCCNCDGCKIFKEFRDLPLWKKWYGYYLYARKAIKFS